MGNIMYVVFNHSLSLVIFVFAKIILPMLQLLHAFCGFYEIFLKLTHG